MIKEERSGGNKRGGEKRTKEWKREAKKGMRGEGRGGDVSV